MKHKKILGAVVLTTFAIAAGWGYQQNEKKNVLNELALANIEALARSEFNPGTCGWSLDGVLGICNIRRDHALELFYSFGGRWCCDSCSSTPYCG